MSFRRHLGLAVCTVLLAVGQAVPHWRQLNQQARDAITKRDYARLASVLRELDPLLPGNATIQYNRAAAAAQLGDTDAALVHLEALSRAGLIYRFRDDEDFRPLLALPRFASIERQVERNGQPVTHSQMVAAIPRADLLPEDVAWDHRRRRLLYSSVTGKSIHILGGGQFAGSDLPVMALALDQKRGILWATDGWLPHCADCRPEDKDQTNLLRFDLATGRLLGRFPSPEKGLLGDMTVSPSGDVYVSEGIHGAVLHFAPRTNRWERLDVPGEFPSPQSPAVSPDGQTLYVADYVRGIAAIALPSRQVRWIAAAPGVVVSGIDGLYVHQGEFLAIQNGIKPARLVRMPLDLSRQIVLEANWPGLGEPTHGTFRGQEFLYLANTGWGAFDGAGKRKPEVPPVESTVRRLRWAP